MASKEVNRIFQSYTISFFLSILFIRIFLYALSASSFHLNGLNIYPFYIGSILLVFATTLHIFHERTTPFEASMFGILCGLIVDQFGLFVFGDLTTAAYFHDPAYKTGMVFALLVLLVAQFDHWYRK